MNRLAFLRRITLTCLIVLVSVILLAQEEPTPAALLGSGTENDPWQISSHNDWNAFAEAVNNGYTYEGKYLELTNNITLNINGTETSDKIVGVMTDVNTFTEDKWFSGTFDGNWNTLNFNMSGYTPSNNVSPSAPFRVIDGATIKNLTVAGTLYPTKKYNTGLVGFAFSDKTGETNYILNCTSSIIIDCSNISGGDSDCSSAGFLAENKEKGKVVFENCVFNGQILKGSLSSGNKCGGFVSYNNGASLTFTNCTMDGTITLNNNRANFYRNKTATLTEAYYTKNNYGGQGAQAPTTPPSDKFAKKYIYGATTYYVPGAEISGFETTYLYEGSPLEITPVVKYYGKTLTRGTDYIVKIDGTVIPTATTPTISTTGYHTVTIEGADGSDYAGSQPTTVHVLEGLSGDGTAASPYLISSASDWAVFTEEINYGIGVDKYYKLENDITLGTALLPINTVVGSDENSDRRFKGHFDGNWKTITIYLERNEQYAAPFGVIDGAKIKNLAVTGEITTDQKFAGGIAAYTYGTDSIKSCFSSVNIVCSGTENYDCTHGGLVGQLQTGTLIFEKCIFNGSITGANAQKCAGFLGYRGGTLKCIDCTMAGTISIESLTNTFYRERTAVSTTTLTNAYYITPSGQGDNQGTEVTASASVPTDGIYRKYTVSANNYYVEGGVTPEVVSTATYSYTGSPISIDPFVITYYGWTLVEGTDYQIVYEYSATGSEPYTVVTEINAAGHYRISVAGMNNYGGSKVIYEDLEVISLNSWPNLQRAMAVAKADLTLTQDLTDTDNDGALVVSGTIVLDLNGHIINRNRTSMEDDGYVIKVEADANLTINDNNPSATHTGDFASLTGGIITGGNSNGNGGGIYNDRGTLTLNNVTVYKNTSELTGGGIYCAEKSENKSSRFYMTGGAIRNNEAVGKSGVAAGGGGIYANTVAAFQMDNVTVTGNRTISKGGGIRLAVNNNVQTSISNCNIAENVISHNSESKGGGIHYSGKNLNAKLTITNSRIQGNEVTREGGGIFILNGTVELNNCTLEGNIASRYNNSGDVRGGGVCVYSGALIVDGSTITNNQCYHQGGGVYVYSGKTMQIKGDVQIFGNTSTNTTSENVYLVGNTDVIQVLGDISGTNICISKADNGTITSGLGSYGTKDNFTADISNHCVMLYDGEAYLQNYYIWGVTEGWPNLDGITKVDEDYIIDAVVTIPENSVATANRITTGAGLLIIEDGGQLVTGSASSAKTRMKKTIEGTTTDDNGWYLIASPVANPNIASATNLITIGMHKYDLYRYNEASDLQWENYRAGHADFTTLENGRGYLYRNLNDCVIEINGDLNAADVDYTLSYTSSSELKGFNIIGNPYSHTIYKGASTSAIPNGGLLEEKYYTLSQDGEWVLTDDGTAIVPMTGILVQATETGVLTMTNSTEGQVTPSRSSDGKNIWVTVANGNYEDRACVEFKEGRGLNKIAHQNKDVPMLYIRHNDEDFASVDVNPAERSLNLSFEAKTTGYYTLSMQTQGEFGYLHLFDKLTGSDVDMLQEKEYSFIGSVADNADRFLVRLCPLNDTGTFAYQSGDDIIVEGVGELEVFDVMGRMVMKRQINGIETVCESSLQTGVYILRLEGKTQKIVVR